MGTFIFNRPNGLSCPSDSCSSNESTFAAAAIQDFGQALTGLGQGDSAGGAMQKNKVQSALKGLDLLADSRARNAQRACCLDEASLPRHFAQGFKTGMIQHN
jgi:hypothetical protein